MTVKKNTLPQKMEVRGAKVHNLKNVDVDIPLNKIVGIAGVSGSGKSSLALGVLYAEGSRRYLESLSSYTRRRMTQAERADVDDVSYVPASLALHQRPGVPGIRSTFGTMTELLNSLRLMFSRLASHRCPNGHYVEPSFEVAAMQEITCSECGEKFYGPGAEDLAFNSRGGCATCGGTGYIRTVDESKLVPNENLTIDEGAVVVWGTLMWALMKDVCREMGVRTDVPFKDLTPKEKETVYHGPAEKRHILYVNPKTQQTAEMDFTYYNAVYTVKNALSKVKDDKGMKRIEKFLKEGICQDCHGTRLSDASRAPRLCGIGLDKATAMTLDELIPWVKGIPDSLEEKMRLMAKNICESFMDTAKRLIDLGLGYLSLDRAASTLSTGERQRVQLARAVRNRTTGVLYVLDEPSIGLHPYNLKGLTGVMDELIADGNSVVLVDHDTQVLAHADYIVEMGKGAGTDGGTVIAEGTIQDIESNKESVIGPYLTQETQLEKIRAEGKNLYVEEYQRMRSSVADEDMFSIGKIHLSTDSIHTVQPLEVDIPKGRLTVVTGVSGSGKTTMVLESLIPALESKATGNKLPFHIKSIDAEEIRQVNLIDATPIGINVRSTVATYAGVHDELRKIYAKTEDAKAHGYKAGDFSYNTGKLRCQTCDGTGEISLDVQFLPDVDIICPDCRGSRYSKMAHGVLRKAEGGKEYSLPDLMSMSVDEVLKDSDDLKLIKQRLQVLHDLGLGYLTLGEKTPGLSGGEAQRLKLASEMGKGQEESVFVFDEPTIGLHPKDVRVLLDVFENLIQLGATVIVIEHDLDVIRNADYVIDMGPGGGAAGGRIVAAGTPTDIRNNSDSLTGQFI
ncbi:ATP-binding cassette domain-containing protein (plasmid) [Clostridium estertheticum]|uniref:ATP-binding cassette domain-containing protein n=1 Tax=Clostridium estertheticum TaxID=238834 RepID=UPI001C0E18C8|nr:ATP-binding cassette domain-containing protein [Clostridium estertheticum]MBU3217401.1 ATP-binding cassette domain-containing protein [Clostridium estertheticum]WAG58177.1 ATP-binding cassette domain-containing protein [Clostridium estertheticum]